MCDQQRLRPACTYAQSDQSLCWSLEYSMNFKLLTEHHMEVLSLKGGCTGTSESTLVKMPHCWKSHVAAHIILKILTLWPCDIYNGTTPRALFFKINFFKKLFREHCHSAKWFGSRSGPNFFRS